MKKFLALAAAAITCLVPLQGQVAGEEQQLDADIRMFTVMTAINVAGYDDGVGTRSDSLVRQAVRERLRDFDGESLGLLRNAYAEFRLDDPSENLSQFVSYALICTTAPLFALEAELPTDLPPEVRRLRPLGRILEQFYREADIETLWLDYQPAYEQEMARYQAALIPMMFRTAGYLRLSNQSREFSGFKVWIDLMGAPNAFNTRLYGGEMQVVVHPTDKVKIDEIQHAFLLHLLDRLSIRYRSVVGAKESLSQYAMYAPALDEVYKTDFELLTTKCLAKAVEVQLARAKPEEKDARIDQALKEGFILTPYFYAKLADFEADPRDINKYYPDMIEQIDLKREAARLQNVKFVERTTEPKRVEPPRPQLSAMDKLLQRAEFLLNEQMLDEARTVYLEALEASGGRSGQAAYGLARVAISEGDPDVAREHFIDAAAFAEDSHLKAMSLVYLGRIEDVVGNREQALVRYQEAIEASDPSDRARQLAQDGIDKPFGRRSESENDETDQP